MRKIELPSRWRKNGNGYDVIGTIPGSVYSFLIFLAYPFIIAKRIRYEEAFLEEELNGYREYKQRVKCRLIPFIW